MHEIVGIAVNQLRVNMADILPYSSALAAAKQRDLTHLIKRLDHEVRFLPQGRGCKPMVGRVRTKIEVVDPQKAVGQLLKLMRHIAS